MQICEEGQRTEGLWQAAWAFTNDLLANLVISLSPSEKQGQFVKFNTSQLLNNLLKYKLTTSSFIRSILAIFLSVTHVTVQHTLCAIFTQHRATAAFKDVSPSYRSCFCRTTHFIRTIMTVRAAITDEASGNAAPTVLALKFCWKWHSSVVKTSCTYQHFYTIISSFNLCITQSIFPVAWSLHNRPISVLPIFF